MENGLTPAIIRPNIKVVLCATRLDFRHWITPDGSAGPSGDGGFKAETGRYHLYVSHACPWAHRVMIMRHLKDLVPHISVSVVHPLMLDKG